MPTSRARILQLVSHDKMGGVRTLVEMVSDGLMSRGYSVETMPIDQGGGIAGAAKGLFTVGRAIAFGRYDAVLTYQAAASVIGNTMAFLRGIPIRASHQTAAPEAVSRHWKMLDWLFGSMGIYSTIVSNSRATSASFSAWPKSYQARTILISHGVTAIPPGRGEVDWRQRCGIAPDELVLVAAGRLVDQKNFALVIKALQGLPNAHLVIAGDGPKRSELEALARRTGVAARVHLIGSVARQYLGDVFAAGQIFVFPSVWETFGLAAVEAAIAGLPVVAADLPVLREVLEPPGMPFGLVRFHERDNAESMAAEIAALAANYPSADARRAMAAFQRSHHAPERMIALYDSLLGANPDN